MDWHSRYVLSWRLSNTLEAGFCAEALMEALDRERPEVFNTDQGSQFTSQEFTQVLQDRGVKISMDGKGRYADNIFVERLWRTVKYEEVYLKAYASAGEARRELGAYFRFYNDQRPHQALGYRTPGEVFSEGQAPQNEESTVRNASFRTTALTSRVSLDPIQSVLPLSQQKCFKSHLGISWCPLERAVMWTSLRKVLADIPQIEPPFLDIAPAGMLPTIISHSKGVKCVLIRSNSSFHGPTTVLPSVKSPNRWSTTKSLPWEALLPCTTR